MELKCVWVCLHMAMLEDGGQGGRDMTEALMGRDRADPKLTDYMHSLTHSSTPPLPPPLSLLVSLTSGSNMALGRPSRNSRVDYGRRGRRRRRRRYQSMEEMLVSPGVNKVGL